MLVVRSRNRVVELASNVDRIRVPTVDNQPYWVRTQNTPGENFKRSFKI